MKIAINSTTDGHYRTEMLNNREHIVTTMVPIVGNTVMNGGFYSDAEVEKSYNQLDMLPAPNKHPTVAGQNVSAFHPLAVNAQNFGAVVRNPTKEGEVVTNELWVDAEVANKSKDGKELIKRIKNKKKVGVSTGLTLKQRAANGTAADGKDYTWEGADFKFDHVAILLNEKAAGDHVGTALKFNEGQDDEDTIDIVQINELTTTQLYQKLRELITPARSDDCHVYAWPDEIFPDSKQFIYEKRIRGEKRKLFKRGYAIDSNDVVTLLGDEVEVVKKITFEPVGEQNTNNMENEMPKEDKAVKAAAASSGQEAGAAPTVSNEDAIANAQALLKENGFTANSEADQAKIDKLLANSDKLESLLANEDTRIGEIKADIVKNSTMTEDELEGMSEGVLTKLQNQFRPANYSGQGGSGVTNTNGDDAPAGGYGADSFEANANKEDK